MFGGRKRRTKKIGEMEKQISYKPFCVIEKDNEEVDEEQREFPPLLHEDEFLNVVPINFLPHQLQALRWMHDIEKKKTPIDKYVGGILGDVMGLGKTVDGLGMIYYDIFCSFKKGLQHVEKPTLIIATLTLMDHWCPEAIEHLGLEQYHVLEYHGTNRSKILRNMMTNNKKPVVVLTTYETVQKDFGKIEESPLYAMEWSRVILDEAHFARNPKTKTFKALKFFKTIALWCVTGTPIVNYPEDVRILSVLCTPANPLDYSSSLKEMLWKRTHLLRRTKDLLDIPPIIYREEWVDMLPEEAMRYQRLEQCANRQFGSMINGGSFEKHFQKILLVLVRLRQYCIHWLLQEGHDITNSILEQTKKELGVNTEPYMAAIDVEKEEMMEQIGKAGSPEEVNLQQVEYGADTCYTSMVKKPKRKRNKKKTLNLDAIDPTISCIDFVGQELQKTNPDAYVSPKAKVVQESPIEKRQKTFNDLFSEVEDDIITKDTLNSENSTPNDNTVKEELDDFEKLTAKSRNFIIDTNFTYTAKIVRMLDIINSTCKPDNDEKFVIFSQWTSALNLLECVLLKAGYQIARFDGRLQNSDLRRKVVQNFRFNPKCRIFLGSLKAAGVGLNLLPAANLINMDPWWNEAVQDQANDRIHRIGQKKQVRVYMILAKGTVEEEVISTQKRKKNKELCFFDDEKNQSLSSRDIPGMFSAMSTRQAKMQRIISSK
jgi:SNF2 family DNA or RNA helicase